MQRLIRNEGIGNAICFGESRREQTHTHGGMTGTSQEGLLMSIEMRGVGTMFSANFSTNRKGKGRKMNQTRDCPDFRVNENGTVPFRPLCLSQMISCFFYIYEIESRCRRN
jgi:hypothetical protein